jgi:hypothetical protein
VQRQEVQLDRENELIESLHGHLLPGTAEIPQLSSLGCRADYVLADDDYVIREGGITEIVRAFPHVILTWRGVKMITMSRADNGTLVLNINVYDKDGRLVVRFDSDGFESNTTYLKKQPDKSTLVVDDQNGTQVLKAQYVNLKYCVLDGTMTIDGQQVTIPGGTSQIRFGSGICLIHLGTVVEVR